LRVEGSEFDIEVDYVLAAIGQKTIVDFVDEVLYLKEIPDSANVREILSTCEDLGVTFRLKSSVPKPSLTSAVKTDIADGKFLSFINIPNNSFALAIKKTTDINIALMAIVVLSPVLIALGILVKITSRGPIISKLSKVGWRGRQIKVFRFRTMYMNAERKVFYSESDIKGISSGTHVLVVGFNVKPEPGAKREAERRRVEIARALITNPSFILLDEPFAGIDPIAVYEVQKIVRRRRERGLGILITDHNVRETLKLVDRAYLIHRDNFLKKQVKNSATEMKAHAHY